MTSVIILVLYIVTAALVYLGLYNFSKQLSFRSMLKKREEGETEAEAIAKEMNKLDRFYYAVCFIYSFPLLMVLLIVENIVEKLKGKK